MINALIASSTAVSFLAATARRCCRRGPPVPQVLELYLSHPPGNVNPSEELRNRGALAPLSRLLELYGELPPSESLRRVVLMAAAGSVEAARWLGAVPALRKTVSGGCGGRSVRALRGVRQPRNTSNPSRVAGLVGLTLLGCSV